MTSQVDLYDHAYAEINHDLYRRIRAETYGADLGQTSWVSADESDLIPRLLTVSSGSSVLEIGSGSGLYGVYLAQRLGCRVTGLDINPHAVASANEFAAGSALDSLARFERCDVSTGLPLGDASFDAAFANDVLCHIPERHEVLRELFRVLRPGARLLFSDALIIGGVISHVELATRSSIGPYFFTPPGENERLLASAGFTVLSATDTSSEAAVIAARWHDARERRCKELLELEGSDRYQGLQGFLACVRKLTSENRLLRYVFLAEKPRCARSAA